MLIINNFLDGEDKPEVLFESVGSGKLKIIQDMDFLYDIKSSSGYFHPELGVVFGNRIMKRHL